MPKAGDSAEKRVARRVQSVLQLSYTHALRLVRAAKVPECNWSTAANVVIEEYAGPGFPEVAE